ncbi:MAG: YbaN family protein [Armatimonadetes bacterium]|nr:YbaN family protein [Armatimonadota bacterium]
MTRLVFLIAGLILTGIGILGVVLPGLPGTIFLILALHCFSRSHEGLHRWMTTNRLFGETLRNWERDKSMSKRTKVIAISLIWIAILSAVIRTPSPWASPISICVAIALTIYLVKVKTTVSSDHGAHENQKAA